MSILISPQQLILEKRNRIQITDLLTIGINDVLTCCKSVYVDGNYMYSESEVIVLAISDSQIDYAHTDKPSVTLSADITVINDRKCIGNTIQTFFKFNCIETILRNRVSSK